MNDKERFSQFERLWPDQPYAERVEFLDAATAVQRAAIIDRWISAAPKSTIEVIEHSADNFEHVTL